MGTPLGQGQGAADFGSPVWAPPRQREVPFGTAAAWTLGFSLLGALASMAAVLLGLWFFVALLQGVPDYDVETFGELFRGGLLIMLVGGGTVILVSGLALTLFALWALRRVTAIRSWHGAAQGAVAWLAAQLAVAMLSSVLGVAWPMFGGMLGP